MDLPFLVLVALTIAVNVQLYRFVHAYRRVSGEASDTLFDHTRGRWFHLLLRRYQLPELRREQALSAALLVMWLVAAVVALTSFSIPSP